jgi:hypothetical protein
MDIAEIRGQIDGSVPVKVYPRDVLTLKPNVPGAKMWAVGLEKTMLTYFEMEPNTLFPVHSHEAEHNNCIVYVRASPLSRFRTSSLACQGNQGVSFDKINC